MPANKPPAKVWTRDAWVTEFVIVATRAWPECGMKHARKVGTIRAGNLSKQPGDAAAEWVKEAKGQL